MTAPPTRPTLKLLLIADSDSQLLACEALGRASTSAGLLPRQQLLVRRIFGRRGCNSSTKTAASTSTTLSTTTAIASHTTASSPPVPTATQVARTSSDATRVPFLARRRRRRRTVRRLQKLVQSSVS